MEKHLLSKSTFLRGLQCEKSLYLYKNFIHLRDPLSPEQKAIFNRGSNVGILAQSLFPGGIDSTAEKRSDTTAAVEKTQELIKAGCEIIYEAAFQYDQVLVILDILVKQNGSWQAFEVKSSTRISQTYLLDASLQYWVITQSGISLDNISLITINNKYIKQGTLDVKQLFNTTSVLADVLSNQSMITEKVDSLRLVAGNVRMPSVAIGEQCFSPYSCDYMGLCWKNVPENSVFEISGVPKAELFNLYNAGYKTVSEIPENNTLDKNANIHVASVKARAPIINKQAIQNFLNKLTYPLYFMDFETFMPAVPIFDNTKPYQHIPFQYSIHYKANKNAEPEHFYFLAEQGTDPRMAFVESLLNHTKGEGTILVFDTLMEKNILNSLKKDFPKYSSNIDALLSRFIDLMQPFLERSYYHPSMKNSHSIKNILHALVPDLNYKNLTISSGSIAMIAFEQLQTEADIFKIIQIREDLLEYCKLDTLAMVKIYDVLEQQIVI